MKTFNIAKHSYIFHFSLIIMLIFSTLLSGRIFAKYILAFNLSFKVRAPLRVLIVK